jgi:hypothetical protein
MSPRTLTAPLDSPSYWRRLLATCHPDRVGGDHNLFIFLQALREHVEECRQERLSSCDDSSWRRGWSSDTAARIPYDEQLGYADEHIVLTMRATSIGARSEEPFASVLALLLDCPSQEHGRPALRQCRGATYKQRAYSAHLVGIDRGQRTRWYELARSMPLSEQHVHHLIAHLKRAEAEGDEVA